jgi:hypothetical protein
VAGIVVVVVVADEMEPDAVEEAWPASLDGFAVGADSLDVVVVVVPEAGRALKQRLRLVPKTCWHCTSS